MWNDALETSIKELENIVSNKILLSYPDWKLPFTVHSDNSDKQLGDVISQNNKPIKLFSRRFIKPHYNYTTTKKEILAIVEFLKQFRGIIFGYEINVFSDDNNLVYATTLSESQRVMLWKLILEEFGPNIQHISGVDNKVANTLSRFMSMPINKYVSCIRKAQCCANKLFTLSRLEKNKYCLPLNILIVQRE